MIQLTTHFTLADFRHGDAIPDDLIPIFTELAEKILEPVRVEFNSEIDILSGYRSPKENAEAHGQPNSEHMATGTMCACDFKIRKVGQRFCFDWMRTNPTLPYHQLILENSADGSSIIHVSINKMMPGIRSVLTGATHNTAPYQKVDHVAYAPPSSGTVMA